MLFETALKANLPMVAVKTDDPVHCPAVLQALAGAAVLQVEKLTTNTVYGKFEVFWTTKEELATAENYEILRKHGKTLVFVNCTLATVGLVLEAGMLVPPAALLEKELNELGVQGLATIMPVLKGMSIKASYELITLTSARFGSITAKSVRAMRTAMGQTVYGLYPVETDLKFYEPIKALDSWLKVNAPYFLSESAPPVLVPRGVLLDGPPGVGKTMAARAIARALGVPLFRLDVATTLNRYIGESEARLMQSLQMLEREAPCVVLFDEVEKIFSGDADNGVIDRMLTQLLWWLQDHQAKVLTVMTTNDHAKIPPPLIRPGRVDVTFKVSKLTAKEADLFAKRLLTDLLAPKKPNLKQLNYFKFQPVLGQPDELWSHSEVSTLVYTAVKEHHWLEA